MNVEEIITELKKYSNSKNKEGMAKFGINSQYALGIKIPVLRRLARKIGRNHKLAQGLWKSQIHEARILASMIEEVKKVKEKQLEEWVKVFNSWDLCDQCCMNLFDKHPIAWKKAIEWANRDKEFIKRAGFVLMACLAVHNKKAKDKDFLKFFPIIKKYATDKRNFVKKSVSWALRQIGKRNPNLRKEAIKLAKEIREINSPTARWVANDVIRELTKQK